MAHPLSIENLKSSTPAPSSETGTANEVDCAVVVAAWKERRRNDKNTFHRRFNIPKFPLPPHILASPRPAHAAPPDSSGNDRLLRICVALGVRICGISRCVLHCLFTNVSSIFFLIYEMRNYKSKRGKMINYIEQLQCGVLYDDSVKAHAYLT